MAVAILVAAPDGWAAGAEHTGRRSGQIRDARTVAAPRNVG